MQQLDHDLLVRLDQKVTDLKTDVKEIKDGTAAAIADHEIRLKKLENQHSRYSLTLSIYTGIGSTMIGLIIYYILK